MVILLIFFVIFSILCCYAYYFYNYYKISFSNFILKIVRKFFRIFFKTNIIEKPLGPLSEYVKTENSVDTENDNAVLLNIPTSDGYSQAVHPDVTYNPDGFGVDKKCFWMVCTPYPNQDDRYENPELFQSDDGYFWQVPKNVNNPVQPKPHGFKNHNSDSSMLMNDKEIIIFYRTSIFKKKTVENTIFKITASQDLKFNKPEQILKSNDSLFLSPVVKKTKNQWIMWTVDYSDSKKNLYPLKIFQRKSKDLKSWSNPNMVNVEGLPENEHPWHIGMLQIDNNIICLLTTYIPNKKILLTQNWYAKSTNEGLSFVAVKRMSKKYRFEDFFQYRGSLTNFKNDDEIQVFYSACSKNNIINVVRKKIKKTAFGI